MDTCNSSPSAAEVILAELVAWYGHEDIVAYCRRLAGAERYLKRFASDALEAEKRRVKAHENE